MLERATRKKLIEHNWKEIARRDSNKYQTLLRLQKNAITMVDDLTLIARRLPEETQKEIFSYTNVNKLLKAILGMLPVNRTNVDDVRRSELAGLLVRLGIRICIEQYRTKVEQDSDLNNLTINHLVRAKEICNAISFRLRMPRIVEEAKKQKLVYLFNWNKVNDVHEVREMDIQDNNTRKFVDYLQDICIEEFGVPLEIINKIWTNIESFAEGIPGYTEMFFKFTPVYGGDLTGRVWLDSKKNTGHLSMEVWDGVKTRTAQRDLVIKVENEEVYVYRNL
ncbi:hypothetical protein [Nitrososphaera sp. AFS]|uniref:hypothetical protein n=1 Tax=Nitrososphaera sp. AFS TaxID=2301191 RepID=UPI00139231D3|nr:hypothetical protein [Nitrososphaera sp. AFS]NAL78419.1 hypothetical protein [Nitrososphaera sp. AFS]